MSLKSIIQNDLEENILLYVLLLVTYTVCATAGAFSLGSLPDDMKLSLIQSASDSIASINQSRMAYIPVLAFAMAQHFICIAVIVVGARRILWPLGWLAICATGIAAGFTARTVIVAFSFSGVAIATLCIWAPEFILLPCRMKLCALARQRWQYKSGIYPNRLKRSSALSVLFSLFGIAWQCFLTPLLIRNLL